MTLILNRRNSASGRLNSFSNRIILMMETTLFSIGIIMAKEPRSSSGSMVCQCSWEVRATIIHRCYQHGAFDSMRWNYGLTHWTHEGSNWIPADNFFTTIKPDRYRAWLQLLKDGNQNMIRVWGGGIYEVDTFYDLCDGTLR